MSSIFDRVRSIDAFRAITMFLMIFVNDLDGIPRTPLWLKHAGENVDGLGLADTIFPAFLFIVGLSIPFAFQNRQKQQDGSIPLHIIQRSAALILIGFFHANMETYNEDAAALPLTVWESLVTFSFFFLFLDYRAVSSFMKYLFQGTGMVMLIVLSSIYASKDPGQPGLHFSWWGILGLIGWAYLICSLIYYYSKGDLWIQVGAWIFFMFFNMDFHLGWLDFMNRFRSDLWLAGNGAMQAFTMAGIVVALLYKRLVQNNEMRLLWGALLLLTLILFNLGFIVRYTAGGISKAHDTPSWVYICTAISIIAYSVFIFVVDIKHKYNWFKIIEPAGTNTFTCYIVPFLFYPLYQMTNLGYPEYFSQGTGGLIKSILFAFFVIWLTGLLEKINIRLKI